MSIILCALVAPTGWTQVQMVSEDTLVKREHRISFVVPTVRMQARRLRLSLDAEEPAAELDTIDTAALLQVAQAADASRAETAAREILRRQPLHALAWTALARAALAQHPKNSTARREIMALRMEAAINAVVTLPDGEIDRLADAYDLLAQAAESRREWKLAIRALRESEGLWPDERRTRRLQKLLETHGFRIVANNVESDVATPRLCLTFNEELGDAVTASGRAGDWVQIKADNSVSDLSISAKDKQICIDGLAHGANYSVTVRAGTPSASAETLAKDITTHIYVRDREPSARFTISAYVLPAGPGATVPLTTINTSSVTVQVQRIDERALVEMQSNGTLLSRLNSYTVDQVSNRTGTDLFEGHIDVQHRLNGEVVTAIPVAEILKEAPRQGVHILSARPDNARANDRNRATQWFVVTDIGLSTFVASNGFHIVARSLASAEPLSGVELVLVAKNNRQLLRVKTDENGYAQMPEGLLRGSGGDAPALLTAQRDGDFVFLDMQAAAFDLTDRGVAGRPPAGPLDVFLTPDRGIYRPGEVVHLTGTMRDANAQAVEGLQLAGVVTRPDGVEHERRQLADGGAGGFVWDAALPDSAMRGRWRFALFADPQRPALASVDVQVADFEPERIDFSIKSGTERLDPTASTDLTVVARYLFGAPGAGLQIEGETTVSASRTINAWPNVLFGLAEEEVQPVREAVDAIRTDDTGLARVGLGAIDLPSTTQPLSADLALRIVDTNGRPVERHLHLPLLDEHVRLGVRPLFSGAVGEGEDASFDVLLVSGSRQMAGTAQWQLERIRTDFQWYKVNGRWNYEPVRTREKMASGELDLASTKPTSVSVPVEWGEYAFTVSSPGHALPASVVFDAGWYVAAKAAETPDIARITLDKNRYAVGDVARVFIEPRFAGLADIFVMDERIISRTSAHIDADGTTIELPVTRQWGPGVYVTAIVVRPMDIANHVMPGRAIGVAHLSVEPGKAALGVSLDVPEEIRPRSTLDIAVALNGLQAGETGYVTVALVDEGVLNVTGFEPPSLQEHYFGQRQLGVAIRDLYSKLIDRMAGAPGTIRSGGDGDGGVVQNPPPLDDVVARFSGLVQTGPGGKATVRFDVPDFNGSLRVDALAWSQSGLGQASTKVVARDPVVIAVNKPAFLSPGDRAVISVQATNVELPEQDTLRVDLFPPVGMIGLNSPSSFPLAMPQGERVSADIAIRADAAGAEPFVLAATLPNGEVLEKAFTIPVRSNAPETLRSSSIPLGPHQTLSLGADMFADMVPGTATATVSVTGVGNIDIAGVLQALADYPHECSEQQVSRATPLVSLPRDVVTAVLKDRAADIDQRVAKAIAGVLSNQGANGSFGLWTRGGNNLWLDAYVSDFLTRAEAAGHDVPRKPFKLALNNLANQLAYLPARGQRDAAAYAAYVLARNGRAAIGDLRYLAEKVDGVSLSALGQAHLAAALELYGDTERATKLMRNALRRVEETMPDASDYDTFGTGLRDRAAVLAISLSSGLETGNDWRRMLNQIDAARRSKAATSTQEDAWTLLAASQALTRFSPQLTVDGEHHNGPVVVTFDAQTLGDVRAITNRADTPTTAEVTIRGVPLEPLPPTANGFRIDRRFYSLEGEPLAIGHIAKGTRVIALLEIVPLGKQRARVLVEDPLPAGFRIDDPTLLSGGAVPQLDALALTTDVAHQEFRADRFVAAFDKGVDDVGIRRFAYIARAVTAGEFVHPAATVVDMYQPQQNGRTAQTRIRIGPDEAR